MVVAQAGFWGLIFILWLRTMASIAFDLIVLGVVVIGLLKLFDKATIRIGLHCGLVLQLY